MKVLWFTNSPCGSIRRKHVDTIIGGWLISLEDELKRSTDIELSVAFFSDYAEAPFEYEGVKYYPMNNVRSTNPLRRILNRRRSLPSLDAARLPLLKSVINDSKPQLIHIHGTEDCFGIIASYAKAQKIPIVYSIQGMIAPYSELYFRGIPMYDAYKFDSWFDKLKNVGIRNEWISFQERAKRECAFLREADYILGRTFWDRDCTLAINPRRKYMVVNEILRPEFYTKHWKGYISKCKISIVSIISGGIYKGFETLLKAAALLKRYGDIDFEWKVAGYNESSKWVRIAEQITGVKSQECNVKLLGRLNANELSNLLCEADLYVHVSHIENSPNSVCEAMLLGMPVIASFAGGTVSLLRDNVDGVIYQDGDPYVLSGEIQRYLKHPDIAIEYAKSAKIVAHSRHNKQKVVNELLTAYHSILEL